LDCLAFDFHISLCSTLFLTFSSAYSLNHLAYISRALLKTGPLLVLSFSNKWNRQKSLLSFQRRRKATNDNNDNKKDISHIEKIQLEVGSGGRGGVKGKHQFWSMIPKSDCGLSSSRVDGWLQTCFLLPLLSPMRGRCGNELSYDWPSDWNKLFNISGSHLCEKLWQRQTEQV
jgi:hypothetical protein